MTKSFIFFFLSVASFIFLSCGSQKKIVYTKCDKKPLHKVEKDVQKVVQTYFIHTPDTIYQAINVGAIKKKDEVVFSGFLIPADSNRMAVYNDMKDLKVYKPEDSLKLSLAKQAHLFVNDLTITSNGNFTVNESNTVRYDSYAKQSGFLKGIPKWLQITLLALLSLVIIVGALIGLGSLLFSNIQNN